MSDRPYRPLPYGRVFFGPVGTPLEDMFEPGNGFVELSALAAVESERPLRIISPYAVVGRNVRVPTTIAEPAGKVWSVWAVHRSPGTVWIADGQIAHPAPVTELEIVVTSPHLCVDDELCCDTCNTHLGCRCPEVP